MTKEEKKKAKVAKKQKKVANKSQVANFARPPDQALVSKIKANEYRPAAAGQPPAPRTPAEQWGAAGKTEGLLVWRIENFRVIPWPREFYGQFYNGDSYIVLNTYKRGNAFRWDIHFWLGEHTTQDEAGTAAYKTVELDNHLGGMPVQHREVQDFESDLFLSYFRPTIQILHGGIESGFNIVKPTEYEPRLLHLKGKRRVRVTQVSLSSDSLNSGDVFILDAGLTVYQWNGRQASVQEKTKGGEVTRAIRDERKGQPKVTVLEEGREDPTFWHYLGGPGPIASAEEGGDDFDAERQGGTKTLLRLSDASGYLQMTKVSTGKVTRPMFQSADVFIFDTGYEVFAWIGKGASVAEKTKAMANAQDYLQQSGRPAYLPVTRVMEGNENESFVAALDR